MKQIISTKKLNQILEELKEISRMDFMIFSAGGEQVAGTVQEEFGELAVQFVQSMAETQVARGWIYFRVELGAKTEYVLLCNRNAETESAYMIGRMALCQIRHLFLAVRDPENKKNVLRQILNGELSGEKLAEKCHQVQLRPEKYMIYVIQYKTDQDSVLVETVKNLFISRLFDRPVLYALSSPETELSFRIEPADEQALVAGLSTEDIGVAKWVQKNNKHAGATTNTLPDSKWLFLSVRGTRGPMGIVGIPISGYPVPDAFEKNLMIAILGECGLSQERIRVESEQTWGMDRSQE